jgi:hypothetical protein
MSEFFLFINIRRLHVYVYAIYTSGCTSFVIGLKPLMRGGPFCPSLKAGVISDDEYTAVFNMGFESLT